MPENEIKLLPCPFCGGEAEMFGNGIDVCFVSCSKCHADTTIRNSPREAVEAWNRKHGTGGQTMQTEKKYISVVEAAEIIGSQFGVSVYDIMKNIPAADVAPVVHAEWIGTEADGYDDCGNLNYDLWECSKCREEHDGDCDSLSNYCPNCGAKMDGGSDHA